MQLGSTKVNGSNRFEYESYVQKSSRQQLAQLRSFLRVCSGSKHDQGRICARPGTDRLDRIFCSRKSFAGADFVNYKSLVGFETLENVNVLSSKNWWINATSRTNAKDGSKGSESKDPIPNQSSESGKDEKRPSKLKELVGLALLIEMHM